MSLDNSQCNSLGIKCAGPPENAKRLCEAAALVVGHLQRGPNQDPAVTWDWLRVAVEELRIDRGTLHVIWREYPSAIQKAAWDLSALQVGLRGQTVHAVEARARKGVAA